MLEFIRIKNIATIDSAEIVFKQGLNIISGETGAGKSIILEAISLLLGSRASVEFIRSGAEEAVIEGVFDVTSILRIGERLSQAGFHSEDGQLIIKRSVHRTGKHRITINGELATLSTLQGICEGLIDLCGQHEHQSLLKSQTQMELVDRYGGLLEHSHEVSKLWQTLRELTQERDRLFRENSERNQRIDFLKFQIEEIHSADLSIGEDVQLQQKKQLLQSAEIRAQTADQVLGIIESEESGILNSLQTALQKIKHLRSLDERAVVMEESLQRAFAEIEDVSLQLHRYFTGIDLDPEELKLAQDRLSLIAELKRKYGPEIQEILETSVRLEKEFQSLNLLSNRIDRIEGEIQKAESKLFDRGKKLSVKRRKAAQLLSQSVTHELQDLKMGDAVFKAELTFREIISQWSVMGGDSIQFLVQTNPGERAGLLGKIASGGELSRLMLAIRQVIADRGGIGVYLFDEIDSGMGGKTAFQVGKKLKSVALYNQVICITHLPQVASFADHHLVVRKKTKDKRTLTQIIELGGEEKKEEIARMLGGPALTKKSLENASELLELASKPSLA